LNQFSIPDYHLLAQANKSKSGPMQGLHCREQSTCIYTAYSACMHITGTMNVQEHMPHAMAPINGHDIPQMPSHLRHTSAFLQCRKH